MDPLLKEIKQLLKENADPINAKKVKAYLYSDFEHYGLKTDTIRVLYKPYKTPLKKLNKQAALRLAQLFWDQPSFEEKCFAHMIIDLHKDKLDKTDMPWIEKWMRECKGWALLDGFIIPHMPLLFKKDPSIYKYLDKWIKDDDFWVRRSALLAQLLDLKKGKGDRELFFKLAKSQVDESWIDEKYKDKEQNNRAKFFIRKAIGWTLRDMSQIAPDVVYKFLKENKAKMSGLSFREGSRKLPEKLRDLLKIE